MGIEIERKFLVNVKKWRSLSKPEGEFISQGYIINEPEKNVRVRLRGTRAFLTIKGRADGSSRPEFEYNIPVDDADQLLHLFAPSRISKMRYKIPAENNLYWEVDEFRDENEGLILAEIELSNEKEKFSRPDWLDREVTRDRRYYNAYLVDHPYTTWKKSE